MWLVNPVSPRNDSYDSLHFPPQNISGIATDGIGNPDYTGYLGTPDNKYYKFTPKAEKAEEIKCIVFLDEVQTKPMDVAFTHFREHTNWGAFNTMIHDGDENIKIVFYCKSKLGEARGGGMEQVIYIISKKILELKA